MKVIYLTMILAAVVLTFVYIYYNNNNNAVAQIYPNNTTPANINKTALAQLSPIPGDNISLAMRTMERDNVLYGISDKRSIAAYSEYDLFTCVNALLDPHTFQSLTICDGDVSNDLTYHYLDSLPPIVKKLAVLYLQARGILP